MRARNRGKEYILALPVGVTLLAGLSLVPPAPAEYIDPWVYAQLGMDHFYNLEYREAIENLELAVASDPQNLLFYNFLANAYLFRELYRLGQLDANLYGASNTFLRERKPEPDPKQLAKVKELIAEVRVRGEKRLAENPHDRDALYALGTSYGIEGNYKFTIEKKYMEALRAGTKANDLHTRLLKLDPAYHDAKLIPGVFQYVVGSIPRSVKWLAFVFGYRGSKTEGIRLLQEAMTEGQWVTSDAAILLAVIYNREKKFAYARTLLQPVSEFYPRNPLLRLEIGRTFEREGKLPEALENYRAVAQDMERGKPGYHKIPRERLWYQVGFLHQRLGQLSEALDAYTRVTSEKDADGLVRAYSGLRRGEIFLARNQLQLARAEYEQVAALPYEEPRREAQLRLRSLGN
jgi:tetratricopeptide (TPR) repeat protein